MFWCNNQIRYDMNSLLNERIYVFTIKKKLKHTKKMKNNVGMYLI